MYTLDILFINTCHFASNFFSVLFFEAMYFSVRYLISTLSLKTSKLGLLVKCLLDQICNLTRITL